MSAVVIMSKRTSNDAIIFRRLFKQDPQSRYIIEVSVHDGAHCFFRDFFQPSHNQTYSFVGMDCDLKLFSVNTFSLPDWFGEKGFPNYAFLTIVLLDCYRPLCFYLKKHVAAKIVEKLFISDRLTIFGTHA